MAIKAIIFDCFGVLLTDALAAIVDEVRMADPEKAERIIGLVNAAMTGRIDPEISRTAIAGELGMTTEAYSEAIRNGEVKNVVLFKYIATLRPAYKTGLLSNIGAKGLAVRFESDELESYFDVAVASSDIGYAKPDAQAYLITAEKLGIAPADCLMIDDREDYCQGARNVGMQAIVYTSFHQVQTDIDAVVKKFSLL